MSTKDKGNELGELDKNNFRDVNSNILNNLQILYKNLIPLLILKTKGYDIFKDDDMFKDDENDETTIIYLTHRINYYEKIIKGKIKDLINEDIEKKNYII